MGVVWSCVNATSRPTDEVSLEAILNSIVIVGIAEIGDKTQLLSLLLTLRFRRKPWQIISAIFVATILNHFIAAYMGKFIFGFINPQYQKWVLAVLFAAFGLWALIPDSEDDVKANQPYGAFLTSLVCFFLAEMGDKTQLATLALGAQFKDTVWVTVGTTLGMLAANVPVVLWGNAVLRIIPLKKIRILACIMFFAFAISVAVLGTKF